MLSAYSLDDCEAYAQKRANQTRVRYAVWINPGSPELFYAAALNNTSRTCYANVGAVVHKVYRPQKVAA